MKTGLLLAILFLLPFGNSAAHSAMTPDVFWLDKYGNIAWEDEKARLDNFAIQLMNEPNTIGYFYVRVGRVSCRGEAQARAVRATNYMTRVRGANRNQIIWRDIGFGDDFEVSICLAPRGKPPMYVPEYQRATQPHVIKDCGSDALRLNRRVKPWRAPTTRWTGAAGACFASNLVRRRLREFAPPGQLRRWAATYFTRL
jgi:hypothetical protein